MQQELFYELPNKELLPVAAGTQMYVIPYGGKGLIEMMCSQVVLDKLYLSDDYGDKWYVILSEIDGLDCLPPRAYRKDLLCTEYD